MNWVKDIFGRKKPVDKEGQKFLIKTVTPEQFANGESGKVLYADTKDYVKELREKKMNEKNKETLDKLNELDKMFKQGIITEKLYLKLKDKYYDEIAKNNLG